MGDQCLSCIGKWSQYTSSIEVNPPRVDPDLWTQISVLFRMAQFGQKIQSRNASARVGWDRSIDLRPPADNQLSVEGEMGPGGADLHTWFRENWKKSKLKKSKLMIEAERLKN